MDDGSTVAATSIIGTIAESDISRGDAMRHVVTKLEASQAELTPEQHKHLDRRVMQAIREPLGNS